MAKRHRSPSYPSLTLTECISRAKKLYEKEGKHTAPISAVVSHWDYSEKSSGGKLSIAALKAFGLIDDKGVGSDRVVNLTEAGLSIVRDEREVSPERDALLAAAAIKPKIIREMVAEYPDGKASVENLRHYLVSREYNPNAVSDIIKVYKDALTYINLDKDIKPEADEPEVDDKVEVGDLIQWESAGVLQFPIPKRVRAIQEFDGEEWVFVDESETGIPMSEAIIETKGTQTTPGERRTPPRLPIVEKATPAAEGECEWLRGRLADTTSYRLFISGDMGPKEIGKLIRLLEAQKLVLSDVDDEENQH